MEPRLRIYVKILYFWKTYGAGAQISLRHPAVKISNFPQILPAFKAFRKICRHRETGILSFLQNLSWKDTKSTFLKKLACTRAKNIQIRKYEKIVFIYQGLPTHSKLFSSVRISYCTPKRLVNCI